MTELVRQAVQDYRPREQSRRRPTPDEALEHTAGVWQQGDGIAWQRRLRDEWDRRG